MIEHILIRTLSPNRCYQEHLLVHLVRGMRTRSGIIEARLEPRKQIGRGGEGGVAVTIVRAVAVLCGGGILAVWIVYPALIGCLAARRRRRMAGSKNDAGTVPPVSIIIATRDDLATIQ